MDKFIGLESDRDEDVAHDLGSDEEFFGGKSTKFDGSDDDDDDDDDDEMSDDEELTQKTTKAKSKNTAFDAFGGDSGDEDDEEIEEDGTGIVLRKNPTSTDEQQQKNDSKDAAQTEEEKNVNELFRKSKLKTLKDKKPKGKTGVVYLSKIPPYMKPTKMRQVLSRFGDIDRLFLRREATAKHQQRVKRGGNKKPMYEEGWAEFVRKKDAKLAADTLNANTLGGRKGSFYYDDVMNVKYLSGFKWADLTEQITKEKEIRDSKLQMEIIQARKLNKTFVQNIQKSKMIENIQKKKKEQQQSSGNSEGKDTDNKVRRTFEQRVVTTARADGPEIYKKKGDQAQNIVSKLL